MRVIDAKRARERQEAAGQTQESNPASRLPPIRLAQWLGNIPVNKNLLRPMNPLHPKAKQGAAVPALGVDVVNIAELVVGTDQHHPDYQAWSPDKHRKYRKPKIPKIMTPRHNRGSYHGAA